MRAKRMSIGLLIGLGFVASRSEAATLTQWTIPFTNAAPGQIAAAPDAVFYVDFQLSTLNRVDLGNSQITQWFPPFFPSSPGDVKYRPSDGKLFVTSAGLMGSYEIGQFDPASGTYTHWVLSPAYFTPSNLALDEEGHVFFVAGTQTGSYVIARFEPATGALTTWPIPDAVLPVGSYALNVAVGQDGAVYFNASGEVVRGIGRLDPGPGTFTFWSVAFEPLFPIVLDPAGNVFFQDYGTGIARLVPASGQLTEWPVSDGQSEDLAFQSGKLFFGPVFSSGAMALDPSAPGTDSLVVATSSDPVVPSTAQLIPIVATKVRSRKGHAQAAVSSVDPIAEGALSLWPFSSGSRFFSAGSNGAVFFTSSSGASIGRLVP